MEAGLIKILRQCDESGHYHPPDDRSRALCQHLAQNYGLLSATPRGWRRLHPPDWLSAKTLSAALDAQVIDESPATNQQAKAHPPPYLLFAEHQHHGTGQRGRRWLSLPADALLFSACLPRPPTLDGLTVAIGAMLCSRLGNENPALRLKWPNDLIDASGRKIAGILVEASGNRIIIGVGINHSMTAPLRQRIAALGGRPAGALRETLPAVPTRTECALLAARAVIDTVMNYRTGFPAYRDLANRSHHLPVGETTHRQGKPTERFLGFDNLGAPRIEKDLPSHVAGG